MNPLFRPADVVAYISQFTTLQPGDVIATGTPSGVGAARNPPLFLEPRQVVRTVIDGLGERRNTCWEWLDGAIPRISERAYGHQWFLLLIGGRPRELGIERLLVPNDVQFTTGTCMGTFVSAKVPMRRRVDRRRPPRRRRATPV